MVPPGFIVSTGRVTLSCRLISFSVTGEVAMQRSAAEVELDTLATLCGSLRLHCNSDHDITAHLLEPIAQVLGAEAAAYRDLRLQHARPQIDKLTSIGVPASVADDYLAHFHRFDPFLDRLRVPAVVKPALREPAGKQPGPDAGDMLHTALAPAATDSFPWSGAGFQRYYHDFLCPNGLVHHTGFLIRDARRQRVWVFNFHRPASAADFSPLEHARARLIEACLQGQAAGAAQSELVWPEAGELFTLTAREREVVIAVAQGYANKQIAAALAISPRTVENHLRNIYEKLHINTRTQLLSILHRQD
jgi:DNA-binding CsgD family transcriptional regulator